MNRKNLYLLCLLSLISILPAFAQIDANYRPITLSGAIPADLLTNVKDQTLRELASEENSLNEKDGREYYALSNYSFKQSMQSGQVYFNDEFSAYLNGIADRLLKDDPELRASIRIYATRLSIPNASAWRNGAIFFNMPLFSYLESEAQIAYVLAHEITHFKKNHNLKHFKKKLDIKGSMINSSKTVDEFFELMRFSRENELEADQEAFDMILQTDYAPTEALGALMQLKEINTASIYFNGTIESLFQLQDTLFEFEQRCDSTNYDELEEVSEDEDSLSTHPDILQRIEIIEEKLAPLPDSGNGKLFIDSEERFDEIRDRAYFEQIQNMYDRGSYVPAMYGSLRMARYYPENLYLQEVVAKSLYWINKATMDANRKILVPNPSDYTGTYAMFICYFRKKNSKKIKELSRIFIKERVEQFPESEELAIHLAKMHLVQLLKEEAKLGFADYLSKFPEGKHAVYAKIKLEGLSTKSSE